jgi:hypothetical protein
MNDENIREDANASHNLWVIRLANKGVSTSEIEKTMIQRKLGWHQPQYEFIKPANIFYDKDNIGKIY